MFSIFSLFLVSVLTLRSWLCITSRALWFCLSQKVALPNWGLRTRGDSRVPADSFFFPRHRLVFTRRSSRMQRAAILFYIYHKCGYDLFGPLLYNFNHFCFWASIKPLIFFFLFSWDSRRVLFISCCNVLSEEERQQINKLNKLEHLNLIVYWTEEYLKCCKKKCTEECTCVFVLTCE